MSTTAVDKLPTFSGSQVFKSLDWAESEIWDMFGIPIVGHSDLSRILTDYGFQGFPLSKNYPVVGYWEHWWEGAQRRVIREAVELMQEEKIHVVEVRKSFYAQWFEGMFNFDSNFQLRTRQSGQSYGAQDFYIDSEFFPWFIVNWHNENPFYEPEDNRVSIILYDPEAGSTELLVNSVELNRLLEAELMEETEEDDVYMAWGITDEDTVVVRLLDADY